MHDLNLLIDCANRAIARGIDWCLVTVITVEGSSYRRPGARMVVSADGETAGTISGGCLEGEVAERACMAIAVGKPAMTVINDDLDAGDESFGTGCNGRIHLLLEPSRAAGGALFLLAPFAAAREPGVAVTFVASDEKNVHRPWTALFDRIGERRTAGTDPDFHIQAKLEARAAEALQNQTSSVLIFDSSSGSQTALVEYLEPRVRLVICGDGHDVPPLVVAARALGWGTTVVGRQTAKALSAAIPEADGHHFVMHPAEVCNHAEVDAYTAVVIMSHNFERDRQFLRVFFTSPCFYIGVLGPARRTDRMLDAFDMAEFAGDLRLHAPVGLDVGAETSAEIALSVLAEIQARLRNRNGGMLRNRREPIHDPIKIASEHIAGTDLASAHRVKSDGG